MSRRSRRARKGAKLQGIPLIIIQVLLGAFLAIAIGVLLGKLYISRMLDTLPQETEPVVSVEPAAEGEEQGEFSNPNPPKTKVENVEAPDDTGPLTLTTTLPSLTLYRLQVGAFSQGENAEVFLEQLGEQGFEGMISVSGDVYRVSIGIFTEREGAEEFAANLMALEDFLQEEPLVVTESLPEKNISYVLREEAYFRALVKIIEKTKDIAGEMEALWLSYLSGAQRPVQVAAEIEEIEGEIRELGIMVQLDPPSGMSHIQEEISALPAELTASLKELQEQVNGGGKWLPFSHALARIVKLWSHLS